jgi:leucyl-tRNA synthetase
MRHAFLENLVDANETDVKKLHSVIERVYETFTEASHENGVCQETRVNQQYEINQLEYQLKQCKNDMDKQLAAHQSELQEIRNQLSRSKEDALQIFQKAEKLKAVIVILVIFVLISIGGCIFSH